MTKRGDYHKARGLVKEAHKVASRHLHPSDFMVTRRFDSLISALHRLENEAPEEDQTEPGEDVEGKPA